MKRTLIVFLIALTIVVTNGQTLSQDRLSGPSTLLPGRQDTTRTSTVGLDFGSVTSDRSGSVLVTGTAWSLAGLILRIRNDDVSAVAVPTVQDIRQPVFVSPDLGWMIDRRSLNQTTDGGSSWVKVRINGLDEVKSTYFLDPLRGWAGGYGGEMLRTSDGGSSWSKINLSVNCEIQQLFFIDPLHGWATGFSRDSHLNNRSFLFRTSDGGDSWRVLSNDEAGSAGAVSSLVFLDKNMGWGIGGWKYLVRTEDGGKTWTKSSASEGDKWTSMFFIDRQEGWAVGNGIAHTSNGGKTWDRQVGKGIWFLSGLTFLDSHRGWAIGLDGVIHTKNGGKTWSRLENSWMQTMPKMEALLNSSRIQKEMKAKP